MEDEKTGELVLEGLMIAENGGLDGQDSMHVSAEGLHILCNEDSVLLGLVPECIKAANEGEHRVRSRVGLDGASSEVGYGGGGRPNVSLGIDQEVKTILVLSKLILVRGLIARVVHYLRSWYTRFVTLDHYSFNGVYPRLIVL